MDRVSDHVERPFKYVGQRATTGAALDVAGEREILNGPREFEERGVKDQPAPTAERREPHRHRRDIDTFWLYVDLVAIAAGVVVGELLARALW
ncbi:MAG TPA: hypothetical protein VIM33_02895 [Gaiellaceae bacterium]